MAGQLGSRRVTDGIEVEVEPQYLPHYSDPEAAHYVYSYRVTIRNSSPRSVMVCARHWLIIDTDGNREEVDGLGVVGEQPVLEPGEDYQYSSYCPLASPFGTMEGWYELVDERGAPSRAEIGRFFLVAREEPELQPME